MARPGWLAGKAEAAALPRGGPEKAPRDASSDADPVPAVRVEYVTEPAPPRSPAKTPQNCGVRLSADPVARLRQALELLDGTDMGPLPAFAMAPHRRLHNQACHSLDQARTYLRRAVELVSRG